LMSSVKEVAKRADVSVATVSRVLNNDKSVKAINRTKVLEAIQELNFKPNMLAKNLRKRASHTIVMVLPSWNNPMVAGTVKGAQRAIGSSGYSLIIGTSDWQSDIYENMLNTNRADGIIIFSSWANKAIVQKLNERYPVVLCNEYYEGIDLAYAAIDNKTASYEAVSELLKRGCKDIVYVRGAIDSSSVLNRLAGYKQALAEAGLAFRPDYIIKPANHQQITELLNKLVHQGMPVDGILAHSDLYATHILKEIKERALHLKHNVGIISFDGSYLTEITNPSLSAIVQPAEQIGFEAVNLMLQKLNNTKQSKKNELVILAHKLVIRET
jgi:LacI family repressor for deo operon, udp, cdd, tsx, nupC, and nupG